MPIPDAITFKLLRAQAHADELANTLGDYFSTNPAKLVSDDAPGADKITAKIASRGPIPARFPLIIGDCLQNLRSSLDYLVGELVEHANGKRTAQHMFPICTTLAAFEEQLRRHRLDGVPPDAIAEIRQLQPYQLGADAHLAILRVIDELCNINKHRGILLTMMHGGMVDQVETAEIGGEVLMRPVGALREAIPVEIQNSGFRISGEGRIVAYLAFDEGCTGRLEASALVLACLRYIDERVAPQFARFF